MIKMIVVRIDDVCDTMDMENFNRVMSILDKINIKPLIGIVPFNEDKKLIIDKKEMSFFDIMNELQKKGCVFALHGYNHLYKNSNGGILNVNKKSEMCGENYDYQFEKIKLGKEFLEGKGLKINCYMAPSHSYDEITLQAIKDAGIEFVTDGYSNDLYCRKGLTFIPCMDTYKKIGKRKIMTICLHPNTMKDDAFVILENNLIKYIKYLVDFNRLMCKSYNKCDNEKIRIVLFKIKVKIIGFVKKLI